MNSPRSVASTFEYSLYVWGGGGGFLHFPSYKVIHEYVFEMSGFFLIRGIEAQTIGITRAKMYLH
jgi:hypothetical protein